MHVADVGIPVNNARVKGECCFIAVLKGIKESKRAIDPIPRFGLGVRAVELNVTQSSLRDGISLFEFCGKSCLPPAKWECAQDALNRVDARGCSFQLTLDSTPTRE